MIRLTELAFFFPIVRKVPTDVTDGTPLHGKTKKRPRSIDRGRCRKLGISQVRGVTCLQ